jgi:hypothetical protein
MPRQLKLRIFISSCLLLAGAVSAFGQDAATVEILTNERVVTMVQAGLQPAIIINKIRASKTNFNISTDELIRLKQARVPDDVVNVMINPNLGLAANATVAADNGYPKEIGVYLKKDNQWLEIEPEVVNWKTGGVGKSIATLGVVKQDVNGHLDGKSSRTLATSPLEFIIVTPEGTAITEYQLIKLNQHSDNREFRTMTGGVFHAKGGATNDVLPFQSQKIATRTFAITLTGPKAAEYGFLPPGALMQFSGAATLGKMYTFSVPPVK